MKRLTVIFVTSVMLLVSCIAMAEDEMGTVTFVSGVGTDWCRVYNLNGEELSGHFTSYGFDLVPGDYIFKLNGSSKTVSIKAGQNEIPLGSVILASGTGENECNVYDINGEDIYTNYWDSAFNLFPGSYILEVKGSRKTVDIQEGMNEFEVGSVAFISGTGSNQCGIYDTDGEKIGGNYSDSAFDLFPGTYILKVNGSPKTVEIQAGPNEFEVGSVALISGTGDSRCEVYDTDGEKIHTNSEDPPFDLFPGTYTLSVNGTVRAVEIHAGENQFEVGSVAMSGTYSTTCRVYDSDGEHLSSKNTSSPFNLFPGTYTFSVNGTVRTSEIRIGQNDIPVGSVSFVSGEGRSECEGYSTDREELFSYYSCSGFDIFPGTYLIKMNGSPKTVEVQAGPNEIELGSVSLVSGVEGNDCSVYDTDGEHIYSNYFSSAFNLFPGSYILKVNSSEKTVEVQPGPNEFEVGSVTLISGTGRNRCEVYDLNKEKIYTNSGDSAFDLLTGRYILGVNGSEKSVEIQPGPNAFEVGSVTLVSGTESNQCKIYDLSGENIYTHSYNYPFDLFPGSYLLSVNGTVRTVEVQAGTNEFEVGSVTMSGTGSTCKVYDTDGEVLSSSEKTDIPFNLFPGTYTFSVNGTAVTSDIRIGQNEILVGNVDFVSGEGSSECDGYNTDGEELFSYYSCSGFDIFPGTYLIKVNGSPRTVEVQAGLNEIELGSVLLVSGVEGNYCSVYDTDGEYIDRNYGSSAFNLFPGTYILKVNNSEKTVEVQPGPNEFEVGSVTLISGTGSNRCEVYDLNKERIYTNSDDSIFDLLTGSYILRVNGSERAVEVQAGLNEFEVGSVALVSGTGDSRCEVYNLNEEQIHTNSKTSAFDLLPGEYILSVNGSRKQVTVQAGPNRFSVGSLSLISETGDSKCKVYDSNGEIYDNREGSAFSLFPGVYTLIADNCILTNVSVQVGSNVFVCGETYLSVTPASLNLSAGIGSAAFTIAVSGEDAVIWEVTEDVPWFSVTPVSGTNSGTVTVNYSANTGEARTGEITVTAPAAINSPQTIQINQHEYIPSPVSLSPPANLEARSGADSVRLTWNPGISPYLAGYNIYRAVSQSGPYDQINSETVTGDNYVDDSDLTMGSEYFYCVTAVNTSGDESEYSDAASAVFGQVRLFMPDANGESGTLIRLPVNIANADGLSVCGMDIYITYNSDVLSAIDIERTPLSSEYAWLPNLETEGIAKSIIAGSRGRMLYGDGSLFYVLFEVKGNQGETTTLQFHTSETSLYDYGDGTDPTPVDLDLSDIGTFTVGSSYILGDLNGDGKVNSADVVITLNIAVGNTEPTDEQRNAGDVSGDGDARTNDAALILRIAAERPLAPESPEEKRKVLRSSSVNVRVPENIIVPLGESTWVPIEIDNAADVVGADIVLNYDPAVVTATDVKTDLTTQNFDMGLNNDQPGQLRISLSDMGGEGLSQGPGTLAEVKFTSVQPDVSGESPLTLTGVRLNDTYGRDFATSALQVDVTPTDGILSLTPKLGYAILLLKMLAGMDADGIISGSDFSGDGKIGIEEVIYILQVIAGVNNN